MEPLISIIVPVFNVELYLEECINSIVKQTYTRWELLLIDDGSEDNSGYICDQWAEMDKRIQVVHQANQGISMARNTGLDLSQGEFISFIDSDDFVDPVFLDELQSKLIISNSDIVAGSFYKYYKDTVIPITKIPQEEVIITSKEYLARFYQYPGSYAIVTKNLYKREIFESIRFREHILNEDSDIMIDIMSQDLKVFCNPKPLYYYRRRKSSIMGKMDERLAKSADEWVKRHLDFLAVHGDVKLYYSALKLRMYTLAENYFVRTKNGKKETKIAMRELVQPIIKYNGYPLKVKVKVLYMYIMTNHYSKLYCKSKTNHHTYWE